MIKWLTRITISREESQSFYHYHDNRVLPSSVDQERADKEGWWRKPDYIINDLNLNSAITHPVSTQTRADVCGEMLACLLVCLLACFACGACARTRTD